MTKLYRIKQGATEHLKSKGYYGGGYPDTVDGLVGVKSGDYTSLSEYPHYAIDVINCGFEIGISEEYIEEYK